MTVKNEASEIIKEVILDLTMEIAEKHSKINQLRDEINDLKVENRKLKSELNFRKNTVEL
jgi:cell division protein FtsB